MKTTGSIQGVNPGDSKLLAYTVNLASDFGTITARRIKANDASLVGTGIQATSSLEAAHLYCHAGDNGLTVNKRLGISKYGHIDSVGQVKIGSIFSHMRDLPETS